MATLIACLKVKQNMPFAIKLFLLFGAIGVSFPDYGVADEPQNSLENYYNADRQVKRSTINAHENETVPDPNGLSIAEGASGSLEGRSRFITLDDDIWRSILELYRHGHHLGIGIGSAEGDWSLGGWRLAGNERDSEISSQTTGIVYQFSYRYHIKLLDYFGYFVGSTVQFYTALSDSSSVFTDNSAWRLPSISTGFSFTPNWQWALILGIDYSLQRNANLEFERLEGEQKTVGVSLESFQFVFETTYYYEDSAGIILSFVSERLNYTKPENVSDNSDTGLDFSLRSDQRKFLIGYKYHVY